MITTDMISRKKVIVFSLMSFLSLTLHSADNNWLTLESDGVHILKLYGLPKSEFITVNLFLTAVNDEKDAVKLFYAFTDKDKKRLFSIEDQYHVQLTAIQGLSVITTMRRSTNQLGKSILVHYQAFFIESRHQFWYVRTELNDSLNLLMQNYSEILDQAFNIMKIIEIRDEIEQ
ncbi:MAG: hypothetical protein JAZ20_03210 [Candidatus Thiodiazotropha weberae]|nr:hypothetical protein [Candidatus Thiodiazotropha lotti]MCG8010946.1 hypothetical protein [Candidatus Thiodiazotropha lotti]MCG8019409.1 hypothetical protein [Candidatus Thiodiazotropha lotti]MCW4206569.1 hypothetical protein [Candidatus Thiodiazotropha lotti]MCW4210409.1 hypothetical protein [Candidatus Thiodiazotropha lotti]